MKLLTFEQWVKKVKGTSHWEYLTDDWNDTWISDTEEYYDYVVRKTKPIKRPYPELRLI